MFLRYAILVTLAGAAVYALVHMGEGGGNWILVDAGEGAGGQQQNFAFWMLAAVAGLTTFSLCRFVVFGIPTMLGGWYQSNKEWIYTLVFGGIAWGVYFFM